LLIGYQQDGFDNGSVGVKMSQEGYDVTGASDDELIFSTDFNNFKIVDTGTLTIDLVASSSGTVSYTHNLGYAPLAIVFIKNGSFYIPLPHMSGIAGVGGGTYLNFTRWHDFTTSSTQLVIYYDSASAGTDTYYYKYFLLRETAN
jgi:hypothetical protein